MRIQERKQVGIIYHYTTMDRLSSILDSDSLISNSTIENTPIISFSRSRNGVTLKTGRNIGSKSFNYGTIRISIDGDRLSDKYQISPFSFQADLDNHEEVVISKQIKDLHKYIIDIAWVPTRKIKERDKLVWRELQNQYNFTFISPKNLLELSTLSSTFLESSLSSKDYINRSLIREYRIPKAGKVGKELLERAIDYYLKLLNISHPSIYIKLLKTKGNFIILSPEVLKQKEWTITLGLNDSTNIVLKFLAHELTHLKQILRKELVLSSEGELIWKGELFDKDEYMKNREYYDRTPWEVEARERQEELRDSFLKSSIFKEFKNKYDPIIVENTGGLLNLEDTLMSPLESLDSLVYPTRKR